MSRRRKASSPPAAKIKSVVEILAQFKKVVKLSKKDWAEPLKKDSLEKRSSESTPHDKPPLTPTEVNRVVNAAFKDDVLKCPAMKEAIQIAGKAHLARELGVSYQSMDMWPIRGMPRTEWTGETEYWRVIQFETGGKVTKDMLLKRSS